MYISDKVSKISPSSTLAIDSKFKQMKADGIDVVGFGTGEPDFDTPDYIKKAAIEAINEGKTKYTPASGTMELRKAICNKLLKENGLSYEPAQIVVSNGAKHALVNAFMAILNPGDEVIVPAPFWVSYPEMVKIADGVPVVIETKEEDEFRLTAEQIKEKITDKTKLLVLPYPNNPTGAFMPRKDLEAIAEVLKGTDIMVLSDEIYAELTYGGKNHVSIASLPGMRERTVLVSGFSKAYAMTGWRLGYAIAPQHIMDKIKQYHDFNTVGAPAPLMEAAVVGLELPDSYYDEFGQHYAHMKKIFTEGLDRLGIEYSDPQGTYFVLANIGQFMKKGQTDVEFCEQMAAKVGVAAVPGTSFFMEDVRDIVRLHYAKTDETLYEALERLATIKQKLG